MSTMDEDEIKLNTDKVEDIEIEHDHFVVESDEEGTELSLQHKLREVKAKLRDVEAEKLKILTNWQKDKADFINARKRDDEAKAEYLKFASARIIEDILPVLDSFDMAMGNKTLWENVSKEWRSGIESIYNQLNSALGKNDAVAFGKMGDTFDPNLHHSIAGVPVTGDAKSHTVAEVLQKGYMLSGKVIRPALVKVFE